MVVVVVVAVVVAVAVAVVGVSRAGAPPSFPRGPEGSSPTRGFDYNLGFRV